MSKIVDEMIKPEETYMQNVQLFVFRDIWMFLCVC